MKSYVQRQLRGTSTQGQIKRSVYQVRSAILACQILRRRKRVSVTFNGKFGDRDSTLHLPFCSNVSLDDVKRRRATKKFTKEALLKGLPAGSESFRADKDLVRGRALHLL